MGTPFYLLLTQAQVRVNTMTSNAPSIDGTGKKSTTLSQEIGRILSWKTFHRDGVAFNARSAHGGTFNHMKEASEDLTKREIFAGTVIFLEEASVMNVVGGKLYGVNPGDWVELEIKGEEVEPIQVRIIWECMIRRREGYEDGYAYGINPLNPIKDNVGTPIPKLTIENVIISQFERTYWKKCPVDTFDPLETRAFFTEGEEATYRLQVVLVDAPSLANDTREAQIVRSRLDSRIESVITAICSQTPENDRKRFRDYVGLIEEATNKRFRSSFRPMTDNDESHLGLLILRPARNGNSTRVRLSNNGSDIVQRTAGGSAAVVRDFEVVAGSLEKLSGTQYTSFSQNVPPDIQLTDKDSVPIFAATAELSAPKLRPPVRMSMSSMAKDQSQTALDPSMASLDQIPSETDRNGLEKQAREVVSNALMSLLSSTTERTPKERFSELAVNETLKRNVYEIDELSEFIKITNSIEPWTHPDDNSVGTVSAKLWEPVIAEAEGLPTHRKVDEAYVNRILTIGESPLPMDAQLVRCSRTIVNGICDHIQNSVFGKNRYYTLKQGQRKSKHYQPVSISFGFEETRTEFTEIDEGKESSSDAQFSWSVGSALTAAIEGIELCSLMIQCIVTDFLSVEGEETRVGNVRNEPNDSKDRIKTFLQRSNESKDLMDVDPYIPERPTVPENWLPELIKTWGPDRKIAEIQNVMFPSKDSAKSIESRRAIMARYGTVLSNDDWKYVTETPPDEFTGYVKEQRDRVTEEIIFADSYANARKSRWKGIDFIPERGTLEFSYEWNIQGKMGSNGGLRELFTGYDVGARGNRGMWIGPVLPTPDMLVDKRFRTYSGRNPSGDTYFTRHFDSSVIGKRVVIPSIDLTSWLPEQPKSSPKLGKLHDSLCAGFTGWHYSRVEDVGATTHAIAVGSNYEKILNFFENGTKRKVGYDIRSTENKDFIHLLLMLKTNVPEATVRELGEPLVENGMVGCWFDVIQTFLESNNAITQGLWLLRVLVSIRCQLLVR